MADTPSQTESISAKVSSDESSSASAHGEKRMPDDEAAQLDLATLISKLEWTHVMNRIKDSPNEAGRKCLFILDGFETQGYPLHSAASLKPPTHIVEALVRAFPDALKSREEKGGRLPLHIACIFSASAQVLRTLFENHEESLRITDKVYGRLPLHFACINGSPFEISLLVGAEQRALVFKDSNGKTPMDLAHESSNPHKEAILKRLEDRTRSVTEAMIERRKQQQQQSPAEPKRRTSIRKEQGRRQAMSGDEAETTSPKASADRSMYERKKSRSVRSKDIAPSSRSKYGLGTSVDDFDIDKKSRSSQGKKKRESSRAMYGRKNRSQSPGSPPRADTAETEDVDQTPKLRNGSRNTLLQEMHRDRVSGYMKGSDYQVSLEKQKKPHSRDMLARFLQETSNDSSEEDDDGDYKSVGVRSLPSHMHSSVGNRYKKPEPDEKKRIAKSFMFEDSSDDNMEFPGPSRMKRSGDKPYDDTRSESSSNHERMSEIAGVDDQIRDLDVRRTALAQECNSIYETISKKEEDAQRSRENIADLQIRISELQEKLEKEKAALSLSETGIQLQKETLSVMEIKMKGVESSKRSLLQERTKLRDDNGFNTEVFN